MIKQYFSLIVAAFGFSIILFSGKDVNAQNNHQSFTIYLVRHAEKDLSSNNGGNPPLTECGKDRSEKLSILLSDVDIEAVYSTDYIRTQSTALPTAKSKELDVTLYDAGDLESFSKALTNRKQNALVVGHSNTTAVLGGLLVGEELADIDLDTYNRVYQVIIHKKCSQLNLLHTGFDCNN